MKVRKIEKRDYMQLILHAKNVCNYYDFYDNYNDELNTQLATYLLTNIITKINYGLVLEYEGIAIGVLIAHVQNNKLDYLFNDEDLIELRFNENSDINNLKALDNNQEEIKNLEINTNAVYSRMMESYSELVSDKSEILLFSILPKHRGRGLSNILFNRFKFDIAEYGCPEFYLYTTSICDYKYYEHKKLQFVKDIIYDETNASEEIQKFLPIPTFGMLFYGHALNDESYDPVANEIIEELNQEK